MAEEFKVQVELMNQKVQFTGIAGENPMITMDYPPPLGDGQGYTALELLLMSLATCIGSTVVSLLRKMRKNIIGLKVNARGIRKDQHPTSFQHITIQFILNSPDTHDEDIQKAIKLSEETYCPVWAMLKNNVDVTVEYQINR